MSLIVLTPKRTVLGRNHVIWAIKHEYRPRGSSWCVKKKKRQYRTWHDRKKVITGLYFTYLGRSPPPLKRSTWKNSRLPCRRNHVCQVSKWNFPGLPFYRGSIFHFPIDIWMGLTTVQRYCAGCEPCHKSYFGSLVSVIDRLFMKLFKTNNTDADWQYHQFFNCLVLTVINRGAKFESLG